MLCWLSNKSNKLLVEENNRKPRLLVYWNIKAKADVLYTLFQAFSMAKQIITLEE